MPFSGRQQREVLPPIKNPVFSLAEKNAVTVNDNDEQTLSKVDNPKKQKGNRFTRLGNPFRRKASPSSTQSCRSEQDETMPSQSSRQLKTRNEKDLKHLSVRNAQQHLIAEQRKSLLERPLSRSNHEQTEKTNEDQGADSNKALEMTSAAAPRDNVVFRTMTMDSLRKAVMDATATEDYTEVNNYLSSTFDSFAEINKHFKTKNPNDIRDSEINFEFLDYTYETIRHTPKDTQKIALRSIINCLLKDSKRNGSKDDIRALLILLMNPQFSDVSTYTIFAHLLRQLSTATTEEQTNLMHWFRKIPVDAFKKIVCRIQTFIAQRLFPTNVKDLPPVEKCRWWIQSAVKVLALLNSANWMVYPPITPHTFFYCEKLDNINLMREYETWQRKTGGFSFCQYPFLLSLASKRFIMQKDSEMKMLYEARESLVKHVKQKQTPNMGMLFLNLKVRRSHLVSDSLNEIATKKKDLKKKLRVTFNGEPGLDLGGLTKEWFLLLIRRIFREEYGMFTYNSQSRNWWFNSCSTDTDHEFNLLGVLMGLAVYNSINLDIRLPLCCYKKLLSPAVVPFEHPNAPVGMAQLGLHDLADVSPELASGLRQLLEYDGDVEGDLCHSFQISFTSFGQLVTKDLKRNGSEIPVTNENREEYVKLYVNYLLNKSIYKQFFAFYHGFHSVCASNALILLRPEEVEMLVCGDPDFDISALQQVTIYDGYNRNDITIRRFWEVVIAFNLQLKKKLLLFITGSDRVPVGGMSEMRFKITRMDGKNVDQMLPMAHTCFNQLLLPIYKTKKILKQKLTIAISNSEGFGIE